MRKRPITQCVYLIADILQKGWKDAVQHVYAKQ